MNIIEMIITIIAVIVGCIVIARKHDKVFAAYTFGGYILLLLVMVTAITVYLLFVGVNNAYYIGMVFVCYLYFFIITEILPDHILSKRYSSGKR